MFVAQQGHVILTSSKAQCNHCSSQYVSVEKPSLESEADTSFTNLTINIYAVLFYYYFSSCE